MLTTKRGVVKEKVCVDSRNCLSISDYIVSVLRPVDYKDENYREFLKALSIITDGAFQYRDPGGQAISVISPLRTAEKVFSKNGRVFDRKCLSGVKSQIACLALEGLSLKPIISEQDGLIEFNKKDSGYELWMRFEQNQEHQEALDQLAQILICMAEQAGRKIHQDDIELLEKSNEIMSLKIGHIATGEIDDFMKTDIDMAITDRQNNPLEILTEAYSYRIEKDEAVEESIQYFVDDSQNVDFAPLTIDLIKRNTKRSS